MLDFDKELEKFRPSTELEGAEDAIRDAERADVIGIVKQLMMEKAELQQTVNARVQMQIPDWPQEEDEEA